MYQRTVLIVEDEVLIRTVLADTLADEGYDVVEAGNVLEAVAILGQRKVDAAFTDVDMPGGLSGLDLARMISTTHLSVPVIIASGDIVRPLKKCQATLCLSRSRIERIPLPRWSAR